MIFLEKNFENHQTEEFGGNYRQIKKKKNWAMEEILSR